MGTIEHPNPTNEEAERRVLTDEEIERTGEEEWDRQLANGSSGEQSHAYALGWKKALRYARDNGYLAPTTGLDVDGVMKAVEREVLTHQRISETLRGIRKALEAHAEKGGDNLRTDTCEPDCRDHGGIEGCSCSECSTPLGPPVFMTYCGGCGKKVNWPEGTDMMPSEWAYPQRKDAEKEDSNLRKPWPYTPTEELARRVPPDTDKG